MVFTNSLANSSLTEEKLNSIPLVFFGRLEERKGLCTFIEAVKLLNKDIQNKIKITFMGKVVPLYSAELKHLNSEEYIKQELDTIIEYEIIGDFFSQQAIDYIGELNYPIVCLTSPQENFPNTALEMGQLPFTLVVSDTGGFRETLQLVERKEGLYWFKPKDADSLTDAINKGINNYPQTPKVSEKSTLEEINKRLLTEKIAYIEKAFAEIKPLEKPQAKVTIGVISYNQGEYLVDCLSCLEAQTYENLEVIVLDDNSKDNKSQDQFLHASSLFSNFKFIQLDTTKGNGVIRNELLEMSDGDYFLVFNPLVRLYPLAIEKFIATAYNSNAAIVTCAQKEIGAVNRIVTYPGGTLPMMMKENVYGGECCLFSRVLLNKFKHTEEKNISTQMWEIITAAVVTGEQIIYYPYPLYEYIVTSETEQKREILAREKYSLRQYLAEIPPSQWTKRQLYMLLTAVQQLQDLLSPVASLRWNLQNTTDKYNQSQIDIEQLRIEYQREIDKLQNQDQENINQIRIESENKIQEVRNQSQLELEKAHKEFQAYITEVQTESQAYIEDLKRHLENQTQLTSPNIQEREDELSLFHLQRTENENRVFQLESELHETQKQLEFELQKTKEIITAMESSKFWKLREGWFNFKKKLGLGNKDK